MKKQLDNTTHITNIQANNLHHQKRSLLIFEELDQLVSGFGLVNKNKALIQQHKPPTSITTTAKQHRHSPLKDITSLFSSNHPHLPHNNPQSKSRLINISNRIDITPQQQVAPTSTNNDKHSKQQLTQLNNNTNETEIDLEQFDLTDLIDVDNEPYNNNGNSNSSQANISSSLHSFPLNLVIKHPKLNQVQEQCFDLLYNKDDNSLITAPTGSGKTLLFEISICRVIKNNFDIIHKTFTNKTFKIIYLAPIKSLCQEKYFEWRIKFGQSPLNLKITEATGDSEFINILHLTQSNIILTTPERFDVLSRKWKEHPQFISSITLLLIDEIHLLNEDNRGGTIEAIVARMKLLSSLTQFNDCLLKRIRIIALSATIPNIPEVAEFLQVSDTHLKVFGEEYRPVQVERIVLGFQCGKNSNEYMFEKYLDYRVAELIERYSEGKPVLVFCQTQKGTINAAKQLVTDYNMNKIPIMAIHNSTQERMKLDALSNKISNKQLSQFVKYGIGFHNAGLSLSDRQLVEENFKTNLIKIICTTSTLAQGVNLPARLVIIKSTNCYRGAKVGYTEYNKMEIDQMVGRAGRPQYDVKGVAVIMTEKEKVGRFMDLNSTMIESHLKDNIVEHINAEIATGTITDINTAIHWIKNTFLYVRMKTNPQKFGISGNRSIDAYLKEMCVKIFKDLHVNALVEYTQSNNSNNCCSSNNSNNCINIKPKALSLKMSKNYVMFETMKTLSIRVNALFNKKNVLLTYEQHEETILDILANSKEFSKYNSKMEDRKTLNTINKDDSGIKYKIKGVIDTPVKKTFLLLQHSMCGTILDHWELRRQQNEIVQSSLRILNCIREYFKHTNKAHGYIISLILKKSLSNSLWSDTELIMKQLPKIGEKLARNLLRSGINTFDKLIKENPRKIEHICNKNSPFGNVIIDIAKSIPCVNVGYDIMKGYTSSTVKLTLNVSFMWEKCLHDDFDSYTCYHVVVVDGSCENKILYKKKIRPSSKSNRIYFSAGNIAVGCFPIAIFVICDKFIGMDKVVCVKTPHDSGSSSQSEVIVGMKNIIQFINKGNRNAVGSNDSANANANGVESIVVGDDGMIDEMDEQELAMLLDIDDGNNNSNNVNEQQGKVKEEKGGVKKGRGGNGNKRKRKKDNGGNCSSNNSSVNDISLNESGDKGNHKDLRVMFENMKEYSNMQTGKKDGNSAFATNLKIKQMKIYEEQMNNNTNNKDIHLLSTNINTSKHNKQHHHHQQPIKSTLTLLEHLKETSALNLNFDILDKIDHTQTNNITNPNKENIPLFSNLNLNNMNHPKPEPPIVPNNNDTKLTNLFTLNFDDIL